MPALGLESGPPPRAKAVCDLLVQGRVLKPADADAALRETRGKDRVEDVLLNMGLVPEADLLKCLASHFKVQFISTEKLARVDVGRALVNAMPRRVVDAIGLCPVVLDPKTSVLTVVTADPDQVEALREAQMATGAREVKPVLARPGAVRALVAKSFGGDAHAFTTLEREAQTFAASAMQHNSIALDDDPGRGRGSGGRQLRTHAQRGRHGARRPAARRARPASAASCAGGARDAPAACAGRAGSRREAPVRAPRRWR